MSELTENEDTGPEVREVSPAPRAPTWALIIVGLASLAMVTGLVLDRITITSKVLTSPGTTRNIEPMLQVQDSKTYDADGRIEMVTVKSNLQPSLLEMIGGWLDDSIEISDRQQILGNRTIEQNRTLGREQMARSLDVATRVALERIGYDVISEAGALIVQVVPETPADRVLYQGDVIIEAENTRVVTASDLSAAVKSKSPGDEFSFSVLQIDGSIRKETVSLAERKGKAFLGVSISTYAEMAELPFKIEFAVERVGGPSALG